MTDDDIPRFDIPRPCPIAWSAMKGANAARACDRCQRVVHDFSVLSAAQIQALMSDPSKRVCARMDWATVQRLGANSLKALALSTMLTTISVAASAPSADVSSGSPVNIRGVVQDGDRPLPDIDVRAKRYEGREEQVTKTDERGAYTFKNLAPGLYVISFLRNSHLLASDVAVEVCKGTTVTLESTQPEDTSAVLGEVVAFSRPPGILQGAVTPQKLDEDVSGATMTLVRPDNGLRRTTKTDVVGGYSFVDVKPGHYELTAAAKGFETRSIDFDVTAKSPVRYSSKGPNMIRPGDLDGDIALCPRRPIP